MDGTKRVSFDLDVDILELHKQRAKKQRRSFANYMVNLLTELVVVELEDSNSDEGDSGDLSLATESNHEVVRQPEPIDIKGEERSSLDVSNKPQMKIPKLNSKK